MRAKWEIAEVPGKGWDPIVPYLAAGWEPLSIRVGAVAGHQVFFFRRLVIARCEAGHNADFDDVACRFQIGEGPWISATYQDSGRWTTFRDCGKSIVAVPVDPYDIAFGRAKED